MDQLSVALLTNPVSVVSPEAGLQKVTYRVPMKEENFKIKLSFPYIDCAGVWHPTCDQNRACAANWGGRTMTMTSHSAPVISVFSDDSENRCTVALSETKEVIKISAGICEENGMFEIGFQMMQKSLEAEEKTIVVWIDTRRISFSKALRAVSEWWVAECGIRPLEVPATAKMPMYSTWYSYHQNIKAEELEKESLLAKEMGFRSIIVDDGWQTGDNNRGYDYCGDWKVFPDKIPNMKEHVSRIQACGMKYMLWYSVPFVGKYAEHREMFRGKMLNGDQSNTLDPRYPEVRSYLIKTYTDAIKNYGLDGLKLDFIDQFQENSSTPVLKEGMDYSSLQTAVDRLMKDIVAELKKLNPEIMIEFRQSYIGPNMRQYGNIFRVGDCPDSALRNRVGTIDLRLLSGSTAVHSDMLMWNEKESPEGMALQLISCVFATAQISTLLEKLSPIQKKTLQFWVNFMIENHDLLQEQPLEAMEPQNLYPMVQVSNQKEMITALYSGGRVTPYAAGKVHTILNGTKSQFLFVDIPEKVKLQVTERDCTGDIISQKDVCFEKGTYKLPVRGGGLIRLEPIA